MRTIFILALAALALAGFMALMRGTAGWIAETALCAAIVWQSRK